MLHNKLVRDKIPERVVKSGDSVRIRRISGQALLQALADKLIEEANEFSEDRTAEELADVIEVVEALVQHVGVNEVIRAKQSKAATHGRFYEGVFLVETR